MTLHYSMDKLCLKQSEKTLFKTLSLSPHKQTLPVLTTPEVMNVNINKRTARVKQLTRKLDVGKWSAITIIINQISLEEYDATISKTKKQYCHTKTVRCRSWSFWLKFADKLRQHSLVTILLQKIKTLSSNQGSYGNKISNKANYQQIWMRDNNLHSRGVSVRIGVVSSEISGNFLRNFSRNFRKNNCSFPE